MGVFSPWYVLQPWRLARRAALEFGLIPRSIVKVRLPFGARIEVDPYRIIGRSLYTTGTYDLSVAEVAFRLSFGQSFVIDIGANIGYVTLVMAAALSPGGRCHAFEPVPDLYRQLVHNCGTDVNPQLAPRIVSHDLALSNNDGNAVVSIPTDPNEGLATLNHIHVSCQRVGVRSARLDTCFNINVRDLNRMIDVLKIDVEGYELSVLQGAASLLREGIIRHIIFEDHGGLDSPVLALLREYGFQIFLIVGGALSPRLIANPRLTEIPLKSAPNWLATQNVPDATRRMRPKGWRVLGI